MAVVAAVKPLCANSADPDFVFRNSATSNLLTSSDKLPVDGVDNCLLQGVTRDFIAPVGGLANQTSDIGLTYRRCRPITPNSKFEPSELVFTENGRKS